MHDFQISKTSLILAAVADFLIAALHVVIIAVGPAAYLYFGAVGLANAADHGSTAPTIMTSVVVLIFIVWGCYALSAARVIRRLPLRAAGLALISVLLILRGLVLVPDLLRLFAGAGYPLRQAVISAVALFVGILHVPGAFARSEKGVAAAGAA